MVEVNKGKLKICHRLESEKNQWQLKCYYWLGSQTGKNDINEYNGEIWINYIIQLITNFLVSTMGILKLEQSEWRLWGNSVYYFCNCSVSLHLFQNRQVLKNEFHPLIKIGFWGAIISLFCGGE